MKNEISRLISIGRTKEALNLLVQSSPDALLLQAQYNNGEKQFNLGLIDFGEWGRIQARVNFAALEIASKFGGNTAVLVQNTTNFIYVNYIAQQDTPGNELALFNRMFRSLEQMVEDLDYPIGDIGEIVASLNKHIGTPELVDEFEEFSKSAYTKNTDAFKTKKRREFVMELLKMKDDVLGAIREIVSEKQKDTGWREAWKLLCEEPSQNRWDNTNKLIGERLLDPIFEDEQLTKWEVLAASVDEIPRNFLWKNKFERMLPDLKKWVAENMH